MTMRIARRSRGVAGAALLALPLASCSLLVVPGPEAGARPDPATCESAGGAPVFDAVAALSLAYVGISTAAGPIWDEDEIPISRGTAATVSLLGAAVFAASAETGIRRIEQCRKVARAQTSPH